MTSNIPHPDINAATQMGRVLSIMSDGHYRTLRDIERECWSRFGKADTQAAISARLREASSHGWEKLTRHETINGSQVWWYRLRPWPVAQGVAA